MLIISDPGSKAIRNAEATAFGGGGLGWERKELEGTDYTATAGADARLVLWGTWTGHVRQELPGARTWTSLEWWGAGRRLFAGAGLSLPGVRS
eukprot:1766395-Rhodomonas_salina.2